MTARDDQRLADLEARTARIEALIDGNLRLNDERFRARDEAQRELAKALEGFKAASNEWRGALADLAATKLSTDNYEARHQQLIDKVDFLTATHEATTGAGKGRRDLFNIIAAVAGFALVLLGIIGAIIALAN